MTDLPGGQDASGRTLLEALWLYERDGYIPFRQRALIAAGFVTPDGELTPLAVTVLFNMYRDECRMLRRTLRDLMDTPGDPATDLEKYALNNRARRIAYPPETIV